MAMKTIIALLTKHGPARKAVAVVAIFALLAFLTPINPAQAATLGQISWEQKRVKASIAATSVNIYHTIPTGVDASTDTITYTFDSGVVLAAEAAVNFDFEVSTANGTCLNGGLTYVDKTLSLTAAAATWGVDVTGQAITLTAPTDATSGEVTAGRCVKLIAGDGATSGGGGSTSTITNGTAGNYDVDITTELGATDDSGSGSISIITDEQVAVTATVDPSITFTVDDNTIGFGTLTTANARWATGTTGSAAPNGTTIPDAAHTMTVATNAASGWAVTYNGASLGGPSTIPNNSTTNDSDGAPGTTATFGISVSTDGDSTPTSGYERDATASFNYVASTTTTLISEAVATNTETLTVSALANIVGSTGAGAYTTTITYIATGTF